MLSCTLRRKPGAGSLTTEDALTSAVFERLAYLPLALVSKVVGTVDDGLDIEQFRPEFWPMLADATGTQQRVEPDVVVDLGRCSLIVEAKRPRGKHSSEQARRELEAVRAAPERFPAVEAIWLIETEGSELARTQLSGVRVQAFPWVRLLDAVASLLGSDLQPHQAAIVDDILAAGAAAGVGHFRPLTELQQRSLPALAPLPDWRFHG